MTLTRWTHAGSLFCGEAREGQPLYVDARNIVTPERCDMTRQQVLDHIDAVQRCMGDTRYVQMLRRFFARYGETFEVSGLSQQFIKYYNSGERIRVNRYGMGCVVSGRVGVTTGWCPCFLLLHRRTDMGSSETLHDDDCIVAVKRGRIYVTLNS